MSHVMPDFVGSLLHAPTWIVLLVAGALVFAEDALFVGFVIPGETAAVLAGVTAKLGHTPLWAALVVVVAAAIVGDTVGYEVGRHAGPALLRWRRLDTHRHRIDSAQDLLARRGQLAVFLGRWVAFFRALMPALAGSARMRYRSFLAFNAAGGVAWGVAVVLVGYLAGGSYEVVEQVVGRSTAVLVLVLVVLALLGWRIRRHRRERADEPAPVEATADTTG